MAGWLLCGVLVGVMLFGCEREGGGGESLSEAVVHTVKLGDVREVVLAGAVIRPSDVIVVRNKVNSAGKATKAMLESGMKNEYPRLIYLIEEGTYVKKGDLIFELDSDQLRLVLFEREYQIDLAVMQVSEWTGKLTTAKMQGEADRLKTEAKLRFAKKDLEKYVEGDALLLSQVLTNAVARTGSRSELAGVEYVMSQKLYKNGYINDKDLETDRLFAQEREMAFDLAKSQMELFERYANPRERLELEREVELSRSAINDSRMVALSDIGMADQYLRYFLYKQKLRDGRIIEIRQAITDTKMYAPADGQVIYASSNGVSRYEGLGPIEEGSTIYPREQVVHLISSDRMYAEVKLMEMEVGVVEVGQELELTAEALPGLRFKGRVAGINLMATAANVYVNPDLRQYKTRVEIESETEGLRPGMNAAAEIVIGEVRDVVVVPLEAVRMERDEKTGEMVDVVDVVGEEGGGGEVKMRRIGLGLRSAFEVEVVSGLKVGERVLLSEPWTPE